VKYDAKVEQSPFDVVAELRHKHGIDHLDVVVPNAAILTHFPLARDVKRADIIEHIEVNVLSVISLFQATRELLQKASTGEPIFAPMGSSAGSLGYVKIETQEKKKKKTERKKGCARYSVTSKNLLTMI
jgi:norsolorinic acid ketoreductase